MIDCASTLSTYLQSNWTESNPGTADLSFTVGYFEESNAYPQITLIDVRIDKEFLASKIYKFNHDVEISVYIRLQKYDPTGEAVGRTTLQNALTEIDEILNSGRYSVNDINRVDLGRWEWEVDRTKEPIVLTARQVLRCIYYEEVA